jgi:uncharacterized membrane protein (UPF0136 family)
MKPETILWIYLVILLAGGVFGFVKARSKISLVSSLVFGALLTAAALGKLGSVFAGDVILTVLVIVFAKRFDKTRKFVPAGVMTVVTIAALLVRGMMLLG